VHAVADVDSVLAFDIFNIAVARSIKERDVLLRAARHRVDLYVRWQVLG
jgi:hypothetical protein